MISNIMYIISISLVYYIQLVYNNIYKIMYIYDYIINNVSMSR